MIIKELLKNNKEDGKMLKELLQKLLVVLINKDQEIGSGGGNKVSNKELLLIKYLMQID